MTLFEPKKARARRNEIRGEVRRQKPTALRACMDGVGCLGDERRALTLLVAVAFAIAASSILMLRPRVMAYRPGEVTSAPVFSRVDFAYTKPELLDRARQDAAEAQPRVYRDAEVDPFDKLGDELMSSPRLLTGLRAEQLDPDDPEAVGLARVIDPIDSAALSRLQSIADSSDPMWPRAVEQYVEARDA